MAATEVEAGEGGGPSCQIRDTLFRWADDNICCNICQIRYITYIIRKQVRRWHCLGGPVVRLANQDELEEVGINFLIHNFIVISMR